MSTTSVTTAARRVARAYNEMAHRGGRLHVWEDGRTDWMTEGSHYERPSDDYVGSMYLDSRERMTAAKAQEWLDNGGNFFGPDYGD